MRDELIVPLLRPRWIGWPLKLNSMLMAATAHCTKTVCRSQGVWRPPAIFQWVQDHCWLFAESLFHIHKANVLFGTFASLSQTEKSHADGTWYV
jgi:hypothetical protein